MAKAKTAQSKVLIVAKRDDPKIWVPLGESFEKLGYTPVFAFYQYSKDHEKYANELRFEDQEAVEYEKIIIKVNKTTLETVKKEVNLEEEIPRFEKEYSIHSMRFFCLTEFINYNKTYEEVLLEALVTERVIKPYILKEKQLKFIVHSQGTEILRSVIHVIGRAKKIPNIYFDNSWFMDRIFLQSNQMNLLDEYRPIPYNKIGKNDLKLIKEIKDGISQHKKRYVYFIEKKKDVFSLAYTYLLSSKYKRQSRRLLREFYSKYTLNFKSFLKNFYINKIIGKKLKKDDKYFYFPIHYVFDSQITYRAQLFFRQEYLMEYIAWNLPHGYKLYVKLHPGVKREETFQFINFVKDLDNVVLLKSNTNSHHILEDENCKAVITINSSVGFESLMYNKPVITLGKFYGIHHEKTIINILPEELRETLTSVLQYKYTEKDFLAALYSIYNATYEGTFYPLIDDPDVLAASLIEKYEFMIKNKILY